ncbi:MAG: bifunctional riboflavin kinase/FAD synthetase [Bacilli bacterium]|nr:bifunctional riboflavin kinase/FAD synthetase [Bacilli bacterium]
MELINIDYKGLSFDKKIILAAGQFDGLHIAHLEIIKKTIENANINKCNSAIMTFDPHPDYFLNKREKLGYITPLNKKISLLESLGIDYLIVIKFDQNLCSMSFQDFEKNILNKLNIIKIVAGFDFRYGYKGLGNVDTLKKQYEIDVIDEIKYNGVKLGSNLIRDFLEQGNVKEVYKLLGRYYSIKGIVETGNKIGQTLGIRTANITLKDDYYILKTGVYGVYIDVRGKEYVGVCNIGNNPTLNYSERRKLEVHIFDFDQDIYNVEIIVKFVYYLREEKKFDSKEKLILEVNKDIQNVKNKLVKR